MPELKVGNVVIICDNGVVTFEQPRRKLRKSMKAEDFPLLLDLMDFIKWDRRMEFRVPVTKDSGLMTQLACKGVSHTVDVVDISSAGILANLIEGEDYALAINDTVSVTLQLDYKQTTVSGVVRRCNGRHYGIAFPASQNNGNSDSLDLLKKMVSDLENQWLLRRLHGKREKIGV